jgi:hemerythrin
MKWSTSDAVWFTEIDDEHKEIFEAVAGLQRAGSGPAAPPDFRKAIEHLIESVAGHFAHEERLMRAARYPSLAWHRRQHEAARKRVEEFAQRLDLGDGGAAAELVEYLTPWLHGHTRVADRMLSSFLRNQLRSIGKLTFRAGTKPADAGGWVNAKGETFDPLAPTTDL